MRTQMFMLALVLGASARGVEAQTRAPIRLRYEAPAGCPERAFFAERMRARLDPEGVRKLASLSLHVTLEARERSMHGQVEIERRDGRARRELAGTDCREVVEGLALITAVALAAPDAQPAQPERRRASGASTSARKPAQREGSPPSAATTAADRVDEPTATLEQRTAPGANTASRTELATDRATKLGAAQAAAAPPPPQTRAVPETAPAPALTERDAEAASDETHGAPASPASSDGASFSLGGALLVLHGLSPSIQPGLQLGAAVVFARGVLDWSIGIGGRVALPDTEPASGGSARFSFVAGIVQLCASGHLGGALSLSACAAAEPGSLRASGENTRNPRDYSRAWLAAGAGAGLGWPAAPWLRLRLAAEALAPVRRDRMVLAGEVLHRVPPACLRLQLGLEIPLG